MNKKTNPTDRRLLQLLLRAQHLARKDGRTDEGYAMMLVSIVTILIFSLLGAFLTMTNLNKSSTNAYVDGSNTFYTAESGLNARADLIRQKFIGYATPTGLSPGQLTTSSTVTPNSVTNCYATTANLGTGDFACNNFTFRYTKNDVYGKNVGQGSQDANGSTEIGNQTSSIAYTAYTFVADKTNYSTTSNPPAPVPQAIPAGQTYSGLNALEYAYTVYATAAKPDPNNSTQPIQPGDAKTVLEMTFKSRIVPLFQFAAFYNEDLEMTSTSNMTLSGRVHTNGNLYAQPTPLNPYVPAAPSTAISATPTTFFYSPVTTAGNIYNRNDAGPFPLTRYAPPRVLQSGNPITNTPLPVFYPDTYFRLTANASNTPMSPAELSQFGGMVKDGNAGAQTLTTPDAGFLRKRNYLTSKVGEYFAKADMRLEMVPDRDVPAGGKAATPWTRNSAIIPFNFTSIQTGGAGGCTTVAPTAGNDPVASYIDPTRQNAATLRCNTFTKGQLQSLRQPVLVLTNLNQANAAIRPTEDTTLGKPVLPTVLPILSAGANNSTTKNAILRALQVSLVATPTPVSVDKLNTPLSDPIYTANSGAIVNGTLNTFKNNFSTLLNSTPLSTALTVADRNALLAASPNAIAALQGAWFLPAPVQRIEHNNNAVNIAVNLRRSGFYDGREQRWITMLQTNIKSLSVWNRDGLYVDDTTLISTPYTPTAANISAAFNSGNGANFTDGFAFARQAGADTTKPVGTLPYLGLGSIDTTEGGLVLHATVNDDLNGDGVMDTNDVTTDTSTAKTINKKNADGTNLLVSGNPVPVDYPRMYPLSTNLRKSPFGFAFNGGSYLPGPLTLVTDQAIYIQGDFNNNGSNQPLAAPNTPDTNRLPAAIMGDTISILSNQCLAGISVNNLLNTPIGQIDCATPSTSTGSAVNLGDYTNYVVTGPIAINAAFLSSTMRSCGNLGINRACNGDLSATPVIPAGTASYSGGINNYMRMLENWGQNQFFNYSGSFVSLGAPLEYSGPYLPGGTFYNIPIRNYNFDTKFNSFSLLPPLSPRAVYLQQDVFKRNY